MKAEEEYAVSDEKEKAFRYRAEYLSREENQR